MQNQTVKGFKATNQDMICRGFQFKVGETYQHEGEVIPCASGFHFCKNIEDIADYYNYQECRLFEVEASGEIVEDGDKTVTGTLTIIREIDYNDYIEHPLWWVRSVVANKGIGLDVLIDDESITVRREVAKHGYGLDQLVNDESTTVRREVAKHGYGLDQLVNDPNWRVRCEVVKHGYGLDILANDASYAVRQLVHGKINGWDCLIKFETDTDVLCMIAEIGYGLDVLIHNESSMVRAEVARQGYGLDILANDKSWRVLREVLRQGHSIRD